MTTPCTRVALVFMARRINAYLRFGRPRRIHVVDARRRVAAFEAGALFCRVLWQANEYGTTRWELAVLQAAARNETVQRVTGIVPGAILLLRAEGGRNVQALLRIIDAIEAQHIDPADVSPRYWRAMNNRLAAHTEMSPYTPDRHAAHTAAQALG